MKYEILAVLSSAPSHGYDIMLEIERQSGVRPSPGSIYPALQMLEDADCIRGEERDGKRVYTITDKGRELLADRPQEDAHLGGEPIYATFAEAIRQIHGIKEAIRQIAKSRDPEAYKRATAVLDRARRELYAILADSV
jgi:DNA-binding PadR family transcriptional regulator